MKPLVRALIALTLASGGCKSGPTVATNSGTATDSSPSDTSDTTPTSTDTDVPAQVADDALLGIETAARDAARKSDFKGLIAIRSRGQVVFSESFGTNATISSRYPIGSLSKAFAAFLALQLSDRGQLDLNRPLGELLDNPPEAWRAITPRMLLTHKGGMPEVTAAPDYATFFSQPRTTREVLEYISAGPQQFPAGTRFEYSNSGYIMLSYLVERQSGKALADVLRDEIFVPAGMKRSSFGGQADVESATTGPKVVITNASGAGGIVSTAEDLGLWHAFLQNRAGLKPETYDAMYTPGEADYGYGWYVTELDGHRVIHHSGFINGYNHELSRFDGSDVAVIVLSHVEGPAPSQVMESLVRAVASRL